MLPEAQPLKGDKGYAQLVRADRSIIRPPGATVHLPVNQGTVDVASGKRGAYFEDMTIDGVHTRVYTTPLTSGVAVQSAKSLEDVDRTLRELALVLALIVAGGVAVAVWLGMMVARTALRPVRDLTERRGAGRPHARPQPPDREPPVPTSWAVSRPASTPCSKRCRAPSTLSGSWWLTPRTSCGLHSRACAPTSRCSHRWTLSRPRTASGSSPTCWRSSTS